MAKQKVALECLSYHATATPAQTMKLVQDTIPSAEDYCLYSFKFIGKSKWKLEIYALGFFFFLFCVYFSMRFCVLFLNGILIKQKQNGNVS